MAAGRFHISAMLALAALAGCSGQSFLPRLTLAPSPHEQYADALRDAQLSGTALGREWLSAADGALNRPLAVTTPMRESGYFGAGHPAAIGYRLELPRGRRLSIEVAFDSVEMGQLFVDLFELRPDQPPRRLASLGEGATLAFDVPRDGSYVLRVQPELLRTGRYTITQRTLASLPFPVVGLTARAVQSEFGAARDAGRREHEGIDIFAPRHTPVVAVTDGTAQSGTNALGGNVVWLRDHRQPRSFYYAHLARAAFEGTLRVQPGDVVGYIGNTGNARTTAPHLHFGIYQGGAIDPLPFLSADDPDPAPITDASNWLGQQVRVIAGRSPLRAGTARDAEPVAQLDRATLARVAGVSASQLRVELPDRLAGYLNRSAVALAATPLRRQTLHAGAVVRERPFPASPAIVTIDEPVAATVLGEFNGFALIQAAPTASGWIEMTRQ